MNKIRGREQIYGRMNQCFVLLEQIKNANSCDWLELDGEIDRNLLLISAKKAVSRHPMAQSVYGRKFLFWFTWIHTEKQLPIDVEEQSCPSDNDDVINAQMHDNINEYSVLRKDRHPLRIVLIKSPSRFFLQSLTTHVYTDGKSANILTTDIMRFYNDLYFETRTMDDLQQVDINDRNHDRMFLSKLSLLKRIKLFLQAVGSVFHDVFTPCGGLQLPKSKSKDCALILTEIPVEDFNSLKQKSKNEKVTMHPIFLRALVRTIEDFNRSRSVRCPRTIKVLDNFSLRRFSDDEAIKNLYDCVSVPYLLEADIRKGDQKIERAFNDQLEDMKSGMALTQLYKYRIYHWMSLFIPKNIAAVIATKVMVRANVICTNVGILDPDLKQFGDAKVMSYISFPSLLPPGKVLFQISSFHGQLRLLTLFHTGQLTRQEVVEHLVEPFTRRLKGSTPQRSENEREDRCEGAIQVAEG